MKKKSVGKYRRILNTVSGWLILFSALLMIFYNVIDFGDSLRLLGWFSPVLSIVGTIGLVFLGIYLLRVEKWAIILAGVFGIVALINSWLITSYLGFGGLFGNGVLGFVLGITPYVLIANWIFYRE